MADVMEVLLDLSLAVPLMADLRVVGFSQAD